MSGRKVNLVLALWSILVLLTDISWAGVWEKREEPAPYFFAFKDGQRIIFRLEEREFSVRFNAEVEEQEIHTINGRYGVTILDYYPSHRLYGLRVPEGADVFEMINIYQGDPLMEFAAPVFYDAEGFKHYMSDKLDVLFEPWATEEQIALLNRKYGMNKVGTYTVSVTWTVLRMARDSQWDILELATLYNQESIVQYAVPRDFFRTFSFGIPPNDPKYGDQWNLDRIQIEDGWGLHQGTPSVRVAVLDDGFNMTHEDLAAKYRDPRDTVNEGDYDPSPEPGAAKPAHGTNCAGVAAAITDNGKGIAGVAWKNEIIPIRCFGGVDEAQDIAEAISWAYTHGAKVISMSKGFPSFYEQIQREFQKAYEDYNCVLIGSSGNYSVSGKPGIQYPAKDPLVIAVGATVEDDTWWYELDEQGDTLDYSSYGPELELVAPGGHNITTTSYPGDQAYVSDFGGTSASAPLVAGLVALLKSKYPELTADEVRQILKDTAEKVGPNSGKFAYDNHGWNEYYGYGRINAYYALAREAHITIDITWDTDRLVLTDIIVEPGATLTINPGVTITFKGNYKLLVEGTLIANGTPSSPITFQGKDSAEWEGIEFASGSSGNSVTYCNIHDAFRALLLNSPNVTIQNDTISNNYTGIETNVNISIDPSNTISNNTTGIRVNNVQLTLTSLTLRENSTAISLNNSPSWVYGNTLLWNETGIQIVSQPFFKWTAQVWDNTITGHYDWSTVYGIYVTEASPNIGADNRITGYAYGIGLEEGGDAIIHANSISYNFQWGIASWYGSAPDIKKISLDEDPNSIYENGEPWMPKPANIYADYTSLPNLYDAYNNGGYNSIVNETAGTYNVYNENSAEIQAENNWWGPPPPDPSKFYGNIDYIPWLEEYPGGGGAMVASSSEGIGTSTRLQKPRSAFPGDAFAAGYQLYLAEKYQEAIPLFEQALQADPTDPIAKVAMAFIDKSLVRMAEDFGASLEYLAQAAAIYQG